MAESLFPTFRKISQTPLRDILRLRLTNRLDWKSQLSAANLPAPATELITRVVKRTRLFRLEKAAVANELTAHFLDGLAAGTSTLQLIQDFGNERLAAKLIRRAKRRGRPVAWHVWNFCFRVTAVLIAIYIVMFIRFCVGRPTPTVDYVARLNVPVSATLENDRAWPLWRQAILTASSGMENGVLAFPMEIDGARDPYVEPTWKQTAGWLHDHGDAVELARRAAAKTSFGFIYGPGGSQSDAALFGLPTVNQPHGQPFVELLLPHLNYLRLMAKLLSFDAKLAATTGDGLRCQADLESLLGLSRQLRPSDGTIVTHLVALGIDAMMIERLQFTIENHPDALKDHQLIQLAHEIVEPHVAGDLIQLQTERYELRDIVQRLFTDDGHGDGYMTLTGIRSTMIYVTIHGPTGDPWFDGYSVNTYALASPLPLATVSRAELTATYDRILDQFQADLALPIRQVDVEKISDELMALRTNPIDKARYGALLELIPDLHRVQSTCEKYLGERDGTMVAISLELYRRRQGHYPESLNELVPQMLPEIPADRITGEAVKYRLIDGKPVVYSVGADRIDDGGSLPKTRRQSSNYDAARWDVKPADAPRGDWVLYPPDASDEK